MHRQRIKAGAHSFSGSLSAEGSGMGGINTEDPGMESPGTEGADIISFIGICG